MSWLPRDFVNLPDRSTPIDADNLNYMNQGIVLTSSQSAQAILVSNTLNMRYDELMDDIANGLLKGEPGKDFHISGRVDSFAALPAPNTVSGEWWIVSTGGEQILYHSHDNKWIDNGNIAGVQGEKGEPGKLEIDKLTQSEIDGLRLKLFPNADQLWHYQLNTVDGKISRLQIGELNLDLEFNVKQEPRYALRLKPNDATKPSLFLVTSHRTWDNQAYGLTTVKPQAITEAGFLIVDRGYPFGRDQIRMQIVNPQNNEWYSVHLFGDGGYKIYANITKHAPNGRTILTPQ